MTEHQQRAEDELLTYRNLQWAMTRYQEQIEVLDAKVHSVTSRPDACMAVKFNEDGTKEAVPIITANRPSGQNDYLTILIDRRNEYWIMGSRAEDICRELERRIKAWCEPVECEVLTRYYIMGQRLEQISCELSTTNFAYSYSTIKRKRWSGLEAYGLAMPEEKLSHNELLLSANM